MKAVRDKNMTDGDFRFMFTSLIWKDFPYLVEVLTNFNDEELGLIRSVNVKADSEKEMIKYFPELKWLDVNKGNFWQSIADKIKLNNTKVL